MKDPQTCELYQEHLSLQLDGELHLRERHALDNHLAGCVSCQLMRRRFEETNRQLQELGRESAPSHLTAVVIKRLRDRGFIRRERSLWQYAVSHSNWAAACGLCLVLGVFLTMWPKVGREIMRGGHIAGSLSVKAATIEVALRVLDVSIADSPREMVPGQALRSGQRFRIRLDLSQPAYVYVLLRSSDGTLARLTFQGGTDGHWDPSRGVLQIPDSAEPPIQLDERTGQEQLLLVASIRPLDEVDHALCIALPCLCRTAIACEKSLQTPLQTIQRGSDTRNGHVPTVLRRQSDENGVVLLHFTIEHAP